MEFVKLHLGLVLVIVGVVGEGIEIAWKLFVRNRSKKVDLILDSIGFFFWAVLVVGLALEIPDATRTDKLAGEASERASMTASNNLVLQTNVNALSFAVIQLAHQYDLSTNALAEANARLAAIKPLKERLLDWFNDFDSRIIPALKAGQTSFYLDNVPEYKFNQLASLLGEHDSTNFYSSAKKDTNVIFNGGTQTERITIVLKPELAQ